VRSLPASGTSVVVDTIVATVVVTRAVVVVGVVTMATEGCAVVDGASGASEVVALVEPATVVDTAVSAVVAVVPSSAEDAAGVTPPCGCSSTLDDPGMGDDVEDEISTSATTASATSSITVGDDSSALSRASAATQPASTASGTVTRAQPRTLVTDMTQP